MLKGPTAGVMTSPPAHPRIELGFFQLQPPLEDIWVDPTRRGIFISLSHVQLVSAMEPHNGGFPWIAMHGSGLSECCQESACPTFEPRRSTLSKSVGRIQRLTDRSTSKSARTRFH